MEKARVRGTVRVLVKLGVPFRAEGQLPTAGAVANQRAAIAAAQGAALDALIVDHPAAVTRLRTVPYLALDVGPAGLDRLRSVPEVSEIQEDGLYAPFLLESTSLVGAVTARMNGFSGAGWTVALLDTGIDGMHPFLSGKVVAEACFSTTTSTTSSLCPGGTSSSTAVGSGAPCLFPGCEHGTYVAGIASGKGPEFSGVAPDATLAAIQVFSRLSTCNQASCVSAFVSDVMRGLEHVQTLAGSTRIAAVNLSLGGGRFTSPCDGDPLREAVDNLRSLGIATVVAAGNGGFVDALSSPACIPAAVSVGSTGDGSSGSTLDAVSFFTNRAWFLSLLAPGEWITSSIPMNAFANLRGTSASAPHVSGAWAVLKSAVPSASVDAILSALAASGVSIFDDASGLTKPRIQIDRALDRLTTIAAPGDFDGDGRTDAALFRPMTGIWDILNSSTSFETHTVHGWGVNGDVPVPGDYDGDGTTDLTLFRPSAHRWYILKSTTNFTEAAGYQWGLDGDMPIAGDYDGDGRSDLTLFRPSTGTWYVLSSATAFAVGHAYQWGVEGDVPLAGDYDGDGKSDLTLFRPSTGVWYILSSTTNFTVGTAYQWGLAGDVPAPGDYDGDGRTDPTLFRPSSGTWYVLQSGTNFTVGLAIQWGGSGDVPAPGDYDGDGTADPTVFRPLTGVWHVLKSSSLFGVGVAYH